MISLRDVVTGFGNRDPLAEVWRRNLRDGVGEITGTLPLRYIGSGRPLTDYLISGNTLQDGTPTPEAPVDVIGCGVWDETQQNYKLLLTVNGTEHTIYLGTMPATRRIKKLVLTGEEAWSRNSGNSVLILAISDGKNGDVITSMCTEYPAIVNVSEYANMADKSICIKADGSAIWIRDTDISSATDFKNHLSQQYAAGTPVTVWYVLAEPEAGIVNEPLMKIGDYADTISFAQAGVTIPTVNDDNVLDMASTVKPSEVYIKGRGIKPTGYGQLVDKNDVRILDKSGTRIFVHGQ